MPRADYPLKKPGPDCTKRAQPRPKPRPPQRVQGKRWASSVIEDPGIPLVGTGGGKYQSYTNSGSSTLTTPDHTGDDARMGGVYPLRASRGWSVVTGSGGKWNNISYRLSRRKNLLFRRRVLVDVACFLAFFGVVFMLLETELFLQHFISKGGTASVLLKMVVSASTVILLIAILAYHISGVQLIMADNSFEDWRLVITADFVLWVALEILVCCIHPPPILINDLIVESVLCVLMFLRLYLLARFIVVHSHLVSDAAAQSLGALNKVKIDALFVFKALMSEWPGSVLLILMAGIFFLSSWSVRCCEAYMTIDVVQSHFGNVSLENLRGRYFTEAMWLSAITFLTVGYGDVTPLSECGRVTAVVTGLLGVGTTALLVAVLAHKLEQSRAEKYVHSFVSRVRLDKTQKHAAADIIKNVLKLWRLRKTWTSTRAETRRRLRVHGKLLKAVREMREAKAAKTNIGESAVGVIEVNTAVAEVFRVTEAISEQQSLLVARSDEMELRLTAIEEKLDRIAQAVSTHKDV